MSHWAAPGTKAAVWGAVDVVTYPTPMSYLHANDLTGLQAVYDLPAMFTGRIGGCIGEVSSLMILAGFVFLLARKVILPNIPLTYVGTVALLTFLFPRGNGPVEWMLYNIFGGGLLLGAVFMATDYVTSPVSRKGQLIYGVG